MRISILASIGCQNLGDELILKNEIKLLKQEFLEISDISKKQYPIKFTIFSYDKNNPFFEDKNIVYKSYFPDGIKKLKNIFKNILYFFIFLKEIIKSDLIVIGGGGLIYDNENQSTKSPLDLWIFRTKIARFFRKKIYFFRVGISIKNEENLKKVKKIFQNAYKIEVRDKKSKEILDNLGIKSSIKVDPVFYDSGIFPAKTSCFRKINSFLFSFQNLGDLDVSGKTVGIAFRSGYLSMKSSISERMEEGKMREIISYLLSNGAKIIFLPHSFHKTDKKANDFQFLKKFAIENNLQIKENLKEVYNVYKVGELDFCLSMRLHSMILCEVYNIPYIGVNYSSKTEEVLKYFNEILI